ncbi:MAG: VOC family protein [Acidimicrobiia bacterium]
MADPTTDPTAGAATAAVHRLNHAVLFVADAERAKRFYCELLGFVPVHEIAGKAAFLRAAGSTNDHDLGLFAVGPQAPPRNPGGIGLYHLAWQVDTIDELAVLEARLRQAGSLVGASDHGVSRALYAVDPDGNEFEVMWATPQAGWPDTTVSTRPLDLAGDLQRFSGVRTLHELTTAG